MHQAEDAHEQLSHLEAGQADVSQASTFSVRGNRAIAILIRMRVEWRTIPDYQAQKRKTTVPFTTKGEPSRHV